MRQAMLHTTKYDGSLHYRFAVQVVHETPDRVVAYAPSGHSLDSYRGPVSTERHHLLFYWLDGRYHDLCIVWERDWTPRLHYVNICTPPRMEAIAYRSNCASKAMSLRAKSTWRTNSAASVAPCSRSMRLSSHSTLSGPL